MRTAVSQALAHASPAPVTSPMAIKGAKDAGPGRPATPELGERRRADLLDATLSIIAERGLEGLRTRDIAARAGVNISTLHYYFGTKEALLAAVVQYVSTKFAAPVPRKRGRKGKESVRDHIESAWRTFEATPHLPSVMQELAVRAQRDDATRAAFREVFARWNGVVEDVLRRGLDTGELRGDVDVPAAARVLTSFIMGSLLQLGVDRKAFDFMKVTQEIEGWLARPAAKKR